ncbi:Uncharacterised protein [Suttonella ornithocola]|uniref:Uncharacterized protein n=1 Tax=Suttonella ornithocola TaxID=279832 RepID=A0A380MY98_9GAMM|nr:Uncharacterised protein [Suttonella ornithocola]
MQNKKFDYKYNIKTIFYILFNKQFQHNIPYVKWESIFDTFTSVVWYIWWIKLLLFIFFISDDSSVHLFLELIFASCVSDDLHKYKKYKNEKSELFELYKRSKFAYNTILGIFIWGMIENILLDYSYYGNFNITLWTIFFYSYFYSIFYCYQVN